jgi:sigma-B regulation protein RsbU (phosphoserine phosphatase)
MRGFGALSHLNPIGRTARQAEQKRARDLQQSLLPEAPPPIPGFDIAFAWQPSAEVSGDYFDVFPLDSSRAAVCIADISGKGLAAAQRMRALQSAVRTFAPAAASPSELCTRVNQALCDSTAPGAYVTMFYGVVDQVSNRLAYESAGHCLPLLVRADGRVEFPASFSGVVGLFSHWLYQNQELQLGSGDTLLLLTDGVLEAENRRGEEFGYQRLISLVMGGRAQTAGELGRHILGEVSRFSGTLRDDASLIVLRVR